MLGSLGSSASPAVTIIISGAPLGMFPATSIQAAQVAGAGEVVIFARQADVHAAVGPGRTIVLGFICH